MTPTDLTPPPKPPNPNPILWAILVALILSTATIMILSTATIRFAPSTAEKPATPTQPQLNLQPLVDAVNMNRRDIGTVATNLARTASMVVDLARRLPQQPLSPPAPPIISLPATNTAPAEPKP